jgi:hypothetical protein
VTEIPEVGGELGCGGEHRKAPDRESGAPLIEGRLQRGYPSGASHLRYEGRELAQQVAPTPELVRQVRVPNVRGGVDAVAGGRVSAGLDQAGLLPLAEGRWPDPELPDEDNPALGRGLHFFNRATRSQSR